MNAILYQGAGGNGFSVGIHHRTHPTDTTVVVRFDDIGDAGMVAFYASDIDQQEKLAETRLAAIRKARELLAKATP